MKTPTAPTVTDELIAELEEELALASELDVNAAVTPACLSALLAERADHLKIISERLEPASSGTKSKRKNWLENIREAQKFGLPKILVGRLDNTAKEIENSIRYGGTMRLRDRISELESERADHLQQLAAAAITAENCELFRKDAERLDWLISEDDCVVQQGTNGFWLQWIDEYDHSASEYQKGSYRTSREAIDAAMIDAARSASDGS